MGFEPTASSMRPKRSSQLSYTPEGEARLARRSAAAPSGRSGAGAAQEQLVGRGGAGGGLEVAHLHLLLGVGLLHLHEESDVADERSIDDEVEHPHRAAHRSEEHTSELQSLMRISY